MSKYIAIGDIHGRMDLLKNLLGQIKADKRLKDHRLVFLGDMIDRGPQSFEVVDAVKKLVEEGAIALVGNHENMMLDYFRNKWVDKEDLWMYNGGGKTVTSYGDATKLYGHSKFFEAFSRTHAKWVGKLPLNYETDEVWFSHAPIPKDEWWARQSREDKNFRVDRWACTWTYHGEVGATEASINRDLGKIAVYGHVHAVREGILIPRIYKAPGTNRIIAVYADTGSGCWPAAPLTGVKIEDGEYKGFLQAVPGPLSGLADWA